MGGKDTTDLEFVVFERAPTATLTGTVEGPDLAKWQPHITVQVTPKEGDGKTFSVPLPMSAFFEVRGVLPGEYWVAAKLGAHADFESAPVGAEVGRGGVLHVGAIAFTAKEQSRKEVRGGGEAHVLTLNIFHLCALWAQDLATASALPLLVGLVVIAVFASVSK